MWWFRNTSARKQDVLPVQALIFDCATAILGGDGTCVRLVDLDCEAQRETRSLGFGGRVIAIATYRLDAFVERSAT